MSQHSCSAERIRITIACISVAELLEGTLHVTLDWPLLDGELLEDSGDAAAFYRRCISSVSGQLCCRSACQAVQMQLHAMKA